MEPARSRRTGILQLKEFSTGKGIKPPIEARFLQVKEKRQPLYFLGRIRLALAPVCFFVNSSSKIIHRNQPIPRRLILCQEADFFFGFCLVRLITFVTPL
jgi:hypothetical protein